MAVKLGQVKIDPATKKELKKPLYVMLRFKPNKRLYGESITNESIFGYLFERNVYRERYIKSIVGQIGSIFSKPVSGLEGFQAQQEKIAAMGTKAHDTASKAAFSVLPKKVTKYGKTWNRKRGYITGQLSKSMETYIK